MHTISRLYGGGGLQAEAEREATKLGGLPLRSGEGLLRDGVHGVYRLQRWARSVKARHQTEERVPPAKRHARDEDLDRLFGDLAGIWADVFNRRRATSVNPDTGQAGGPMIRFFRACLMPVFKEDTPSDDAIRSRIRQTARGAAPLNN